MQADDALEPATLEEPVGQAVAPAYAVPSPAPVVPVQ